MEVSYGEGLAIHTGPESCAVVRKGGGEALTGVRAGRVLSRETELRPGCRHIRGCWKATSSVPLSRGAFGPRAVRDPVHARMHFAQEPGDPTSA